jgi:Co/Zn/Cd efflux system component
MANRGGYLESVEKIPEPHAFTAHVGMGQQDYPVAMAERMRDAIEADGDRLTDLHLWRLGPGHLGAIVSVSTAKQRGPDYYRQMLGRFRSLSHVTVEIESR